MAKRIDFNTDELTKGVNIVADAVKTTMGARGRTVIMERPYGGPVATKDGMTVAKSITLEDPVQNMGASMVREVATQVADIAGDGTTCATVLTQYLLNEGRKAIIAGRNPMDITRGIKIAVDQAIAFIDETAKKIETNEEIKQVSTISANGDEQLGSLLADAVDKIGRDGVITVDVAKGKDTEIDIAKGFKFDQGYLSPYFASDIDNMVYEYTNVRTLVSTKRITNLKSLLPVLEPIAKSGEPLLIIADEIDGEPMGALVVNRVKGGMKVCAVKAPGFGNTRKDIMGDIAALTGATLITDEMGMSFENVTIDDLGVASRVVVDHKSTLIIGGNAEQDAVDTRVAEIRAALDKADSDYAKEKLRERLARLTGGVAVIKVGGMTEAEVNEKKDRVDDAVAAVRAALDEGVVAGGGVMLLRTAETLTKRIMEKGDVAAGVDIVLRAMHAPISQIASNAGVSGEVVIANILAEDTNLDYGYNVAENTYVDMFKAGIIDPALVVKTALRCAASCATTILSSGCVVSEIPVKEEPKTPSAR